MNLKREGVVVYGLKNEMWFYLGKADEIFEQELGHELTVSNAVYPRSYPSKHTRGEAVDARTREHFDWSTYRHTPEMYRVVHRLRARLDLRGFDIILEPDETSDKDILKRFRDEQLDGIIGHHDRANVTPEQMDDLRRQIAPHLHAELDFHDGEVLWAKVD